MTTKYPLTLWLLEISKYMGKDEHDPAIKAWLKSDGATVGDPAVYPWCADAVQTAIKNTIKDEPFPGKVGKNPYFALNWLDFGVPCGIEYGAIAVFKRDGGGHVGFIVGVDKKNKKLRIRGGNQKNMVCDAWLDEERLVGCRKPLAYAGVALPPAPEMNSTGEIISTNEA